ncbi:uncharacterized protein V1510DRAFT_412561 [Dipodascopsis tothii]|uniref:uncharacterized protein n=1 Tax=Dipodascopsis tothii TaxID=44089 RepID=UPI0034CDB743
MSQADETEIRRRKSVASREQCRDVLRVFNDCAKGRTVTVAWACVAEKKAMMACMMKYAEDPVQHDLVTAEFLREKRQKIEAAIQQKEAEAAGR